MVWGAYALEETNMAEDANIFDLRDVLLEIEPTRDTVDIWFDREGSDALTALEKQIANFHLATDDDEQRKLDEKELEKVVNEYAAKLKEYRHKKYTFHLRSIPRGKKQEIELEGLKAVPYRRDAFGRDDVEQEYKRSLKLNDLTLQAYTEKIVNPVGAEQVEPPLEVIEIINTRAPESAIVKLQEAIRKINDDSDLQRHGHQDPDFLSKP